MDSQSPVKDHSARSPFAGCAIFIVAVAVMVFLIGFSVLTLFRQYGAIEKFTGAKPALVELTPLENREPDLNNLAERIETFRHQLAGDDIATLILTVDDLNLAIAAYDAFKELRQTFRVTGVDAKSMRIAISFPLNGKPRFAKDGEPGWLASDPRFLNGNLVAVPKLLNHEIILSIDQIEVPGAAVPREFIDQMSPYRITERYLADKVLGPAMKKLTRVELADGKILLTRNPKETPANTITDQQVDSAATRLFTTLGIAACAFIAFAGMIIMIGTRAKARRQ